MYFNIYSIYIYIYYINGERVDLLRSCLEPDALNFSLRKLLVYIINIKVYKIEFR